MPSPTLSEVEGIKTKTALTRGRNDHLSTKKSIPVTFTYSFEREAIKSTVY